MKTKPTHVLKGAGYLLLFPIFTIVPAVRVSTCFAAPAVTQIAAGFYHSLFVESDGSLWGMGSNGEGQLGLGSVPTNYNIPQQLVSSNVLSVAAGQVHSLFKKSGGSLWGMGNNREGELGDGSYLNHYIPEQIVGSQVTVIAAGNLQSFFGQFRSPAGPGSLWAMGDSLNGQLGIGTTTITNVPQEIVSTSAFGSPAVTAIASGANHSLFVRPGGSLWAMGFNGSSELGDGTTMERDFPEEILTSGVTAVAAGNAHSLFIKSDGSLWGMGSNGAGELGEGTVDVSHVPVMIVQSNVVAAAAGVHHSLFIKSDGSLWGMGFNADGELGDGTTNNAYVPVMIVQSNVVAAAAGVYHSLFIKSDGSLWGMGDNSAGQLGLPAANATSIHLPTQITPPAVLNGGFETGDFTGWTSNGNFSSTYNLVSIKPGYVHSGTYGVELGPVGSLGYLSQTLPTTPGATYTLSFWLDSPDGDTPNEFLVSWNGVTLMDQTNLAALGWINPQFEVTATGTSSVLEFGFRDDSTYLGLDDIRIVQLTQPTIVSIGLSETNLVLNCGNGMAGCTYATLTSADVALPLNQWTPIATNVLGANGSFTITAANAVNPGSTQRFFILQVQN